MKLFVACHLNMSVRSWHPCDSKASGAKALDPRQRIIRPNDVYRREGQSPQVAANSNGMRMLAELFSDSLCAGVISISHGQL